MARQRRGSNVSAVSSMPESEQELSSLYDYLLKIILLGPSGSGKTCLLHRFTHNAFRPLTSQTIGVEFASKIIRIGSGPRSNQRRIKLQLWDTAGTERFRSVSRSYYRGAAGAILCYDVSDRKSFEALPSFLRDARALASPGLAVVVAGCKVDTTEEEQGGGTEGGGWNAGGMGQGEEGFGTSYSSTTTVVSGSLYTGANGSVRGGGGGGGGAGTPSIGARQTMTVAPNGRAVPAARASTWASTSEVPVAVEVSAYSGEGVEDLFSKLAKMILTKIELGEIDPDDPASGIQYGDSLPWDGGGEAGSIKSGKGGWFGGGLVRRRGKGRPGTREGAGVVGGLREWEEVFRLDNRGKRGGCC